ncbi:MAG: M64 family metallopeptidase [Rikenellaceae bacterium]
MNRNFILTLVLTMVSLSASAQFSKHFLPKTLRMDYYHCGTATSESICFDELIEEPYWAGNPEKCITTTYWGNQKLSVYDSATKELVYSQGYCTIFTEWQTTVEASTVARCYPESVVMPFPKNAVTVEISSRDKQNNWVKIFEYEIDPSNYWIRKSTPSLETFDVIYSGNPANKIDIVLLAEGYTEVHREKFYEDCEVFAKELLSYEPFKSRRTDFNIRGVWSPSEELGVNMPGEHVWKNTVLNSQFYTFDSERYLIVNDQQKVRDLAANVPYDLVYILADTKKYGGGGIYNFYGISAAGDKSFAGKVYVHEFGHLFAGLGDEYVGDDEYENPFYSQGVEPWEENLTTLTNFKDKEWSKLVPKGVKIPTKESSASDTQVGVYEGGGYQSKGVYRPWINCLMRTLSPDEFCPVCQQALVKRMDELTK